MAWSWASVGIKWHGVGLVLGSKGMELGLCWDQRAWSWASVGIKWHGVGLVLGSKGMELG